MIHPDAKKSLIAKLSLAAGQAEEAAILGFRSQRGRWPEFSWSTVTWGEGNTVHVDGFAGDVVPPGIRTVHHVGTLNRLEISE